MEAEVVIMEEACLCPSVSTSNIVGPGVAVLHVAVDVLR
jgi:hypothetical protein